MLKDNKEILTGKVDKIKKPYKPCEIEITLLSGDVMFSSAFSTNGTYDGFDDWNPFKGLW